MVKGIKPGSYFKRKEENLNKKYAIKAVELLDLDADLSKNGLWNKVRKALNLGELSPNSQMDVVLVLWSEKLIQLK